MGCIFNYSKCMWKWGEFKGAEKVSLDCHHGAEGGDKQKGLVIAFVYLATL